MEIVTGQLLTASQYTAVGAGRGLPKTMAGSHRPVLESFLPDTTASE